MNARATLLLAALWTAPAAAQDDFSAFEEMEKKAFAAFEEADRGVRIEWERREEEVARTWGQQRAALLKRFGITAKSARKDPLRQVVTKEAAKAAAQSEVDFSAGKVKVEAVAVGATEAEARQKAEELAKATLQETVGQVPAVAGKKLADQVAADERDKSVSSTHDEKEKSSAALKDGKVEARVRLEQPLTGENGLTALALENTSAADVPPVAPPAQAPEALKPEPAKSVAPEAAPEPIKPESIAAAEMPQAEPAPAAAPEKSAVAEPAPVPAAPEPVKPEPSAVPAPEAAAAPVATEPAPSAAPAPEKAAAPAPTAAPSGPFTGLLLDASGVRGARPALVPTVRGQSGVLVYGPATVKKERAIHGMAKWLRAESEVQETAVLGKNPLRVSVAAMKRGGAMTIADADTARLKAADSGFLADCKVAVLLGK